MNQHKLIFCSLVFVLIAGMATPAFAVGSDAAGYIGPDGGANLTLMPTQVECDGINTFGDRTMFDMFVGQTTLEDFTDTSHFPIPTGILNSLTNEPAINLFPGDIQPGVTYSTPVGSGNFFNIDFGGNFPGGFLDSLSNPEVEPLTITFDNPVGAFAFDTNSLMGTGFDIEIQFTSGLPFIANFPVDNNVALQFFGFQSQTSNIETVIISGTGINSFDWAIDNFSFGGQGCAAVGGEILPISMTSLFVAGSIANAVWLVPVVASAAAFGIFILRKK